MTSCHDAMVRRVLLKRAGSFHSLDLAACRSNSAPVPRLRLPALPDRFTPSMANNSRPTRPCASRMNSAWANERAISLPRLRMKPARVLKSGA